MSLDLLLNILHPWYDNPSQLLHSALHGAQLLRESHRRLYWKLGREDATLFSYALYNILSRDSGHQPEGSRYQSEAEEVIKGLEKAYPTLKESFRRDRVPGILFDEGEKLGYFSSARVATVEQRQRLYLLEQARAGQTRRRAKQFYEAFKDGGFGLPAVEEDNVGKSPNSYR